MLARSLGWLLLIATVGLNCLLGVSYTREAMAIDRCLDAGGSFHYEANACDHAASHPFVPFANRHPQAVGVAVVSALAAFMGLSLILRTSPRSAT